MLSTTIVHHTLMQAPREGAVISPLLFYAYRGFHTVHRIWWWNQRREVYANSDHLVKLFAGQTLNWIAGENFLIRLSAQMVLIATRIAECLEEQAALYREGGLLWEGVAGSPSFLYPKVKWEKKISSSSFHHRFKRIKRHTHARLSRIVNALWLIIKRLFVLSMRTMDAIGAFSYNAMTRHEAVGEFFIHCSKWTTLFMEHKAKMLEGLKDHENMIATVLKEVGAPITVKQLICAVEKSIEIGEGVSKTTETVAQDALKRVVYGFCHTLGIPLSSGFVPPLKPYWITT